MGQDRIKFKHETIEIIKSFNGSCVSMELVEDMANKIKKLDPDQAILMAICIGFNNSPQLWKEICELKVAKGEL